MTATARPAARDHAPPQSLDERRRAGWLLSPYSAPRWVVSSTGDAARTAEIDFDEVMPDGRRLPEWHRLCATVREYAWWLRDPRYSRIDDAKTHAIMVRNMILLAHAVALRGLSSFAHVEPFDLEQLVEECRYGSDAVLRASDRVDAHLKSLAAEDRVRPRPYGGLPRYVIPSNGVQTREIHAAPVVAACNIPNGATRLPRVARLIDGAARANGLACSATELVPEPLNNLTAQALQRWLDPIEQLYAMRNHVEAEAIRFKPFPVGAARLAAVKGVGTVRTPIPPPRLALHLLEHAARWVLDRTDGTVGPGRSLGEVRLTATACWILIAAFSARRDREIDEMTADCTRGDEATGWWLETHIEKTLQRKSWIPVPGLVVRAVRLMVDVSADARASSGDDSIFQWRGVDGAVTMLDVGRYLDLFAAQVNVPPHKPRGGQAEPWHWHPHQFRRFFAVLYFYRYEGASLEALSHHLRHFSLEMTRRYVTQDPEVAALWTDVEWGYMGHVARSIVAGERSVAGSMGERLKRGARHLVDNFRRKLQVASPDRVGASLTIIMQRQGLVLTPKPWVTCSCPSTRDAAAKAACRRDLPTGDGTAVGPNFAHAGPTVCPSCPHAIVEGARTPFVQDEVARLGAVPAPRADSLFGVLEQARVVELRRVLDGQYVSARPLAVASVDEGDGR